LLWPGYPQRSCLRQRSRGRSNINFPSDLQGQGPSGRALGPGPTPSPRPAGCLLHPRGPGLQGHFPRPAPVSSRLCHSRRPREKCKQNHSLHPTVRSRYPRPFALLQQVHSAAGGNAAPHPFSA
jgi:hypothetical protein